MAISCRIGAWGGAEAITQCGERKRAKIDEDTANTRVTTTAPCGQRTKRTACMAAQSPTRAQSCRRTNRSCERPGGGGVGRARGRRRASNYKANKKHHLDTRRTRTTLHWSPGNLRAVLRAPPDATHAADGQHGGTWLARTRQVPHLDQAIAPTAAERFASNNGDDAANKRTLRQAGSQTYIHTTNKQKTTLYHHRVPGNQVLIFWMPVDCADKPLVRGDRALAVRGLANVPDLR